MLLANKRLPFGNQILMSLLKSILGKRNFIKYVHVQMALPKKKFKYVVFVMKKYC